MERHHHHHHQHQQQQEQQNEYYRALHQHQQAQAQALNRQQFGQYQSQQQGHDVSHHAPQHYTSQESQGHPSNWGFPHGKRGRDSPTFGDSAVGIQQSFKRLKVLDEGNSATTITPNPSSAESSTQQDAPSRGAGQSAGEQSREPSNNSTSTTSAADYQSMNSMLGNLHMLRQQRVPQPPSQPSATDQNVPYPHPHSAAAVYRGPPRPGHAPSTTTHKNPKSLRTSSKLY